MLRAQYHGVKNRFFCSAEAYFSKGAQYKELLALMITPADAQPLLISSIAIAYETASIPLPIIADKLAVSLRYTPTKRVTTNTSVFNRNAHSHQPHFSDLFHCITREPMLFVNFSSNRSKLNVCKRTARFNKLSMLLFKERPLRIVPVKSSSTYWRFFSNNR